MGCLVEGCLQILGQKTLNHGWHRYTRMGRRGATLGQAKLDLLNQTLWQASLPTRLFLNRLLASRAAPLFRALREMLGILETKIQGCDWLTKRGDFLGKHPKACLLVVFQNSSSIRPANQAWVFRAKNWFGHIRVNP
jgi:hypothetical protein